MRVFISYRREDSAGHTGRLFDSLRSHFGDKNVFLDLSGIDSGQVFTDTIQQAIRSADVFLAVMGREWLTCARDGQRRIDDPADLVRTEIATALEQKVPVIPVLVDGTPPPVESLLPEPLRSLAQRDAHDITDERWTYDVERLIGMMERLAGSPGGRARSRWVVAAVLLVIAVAAGVATLVYSRSSSSPAIAGEPAVPVAPPAARLAGTWTAAVKYSWGAQYDEQFVFDVDRNQVGGTASFLRVPRGIVNGSVEGDRIQFETRTMEPLGDQEYPITHRYRGRVTSDTLEFTMQSEGRTTEVPITFTASRADAATPSPGDGR